VPDDVARSVPDHLRSSRDYDVLDRAYEFRAGYGAWPRTWVEFCHGLGHLARAAANEKLQAADAFVAPQQKKEQWRQWVHDHQYLAGG
jgi:hypothetical protein